MRFKFFLTIGLSLFLSACAQQDEKKFSDRAEIEGRAANKADQDAQNERAKLMEDDLAHRHLFYGAIEGVYAGSIQWNDQKYNIKFTIVRSLPPYNGNRIRQISEVESDLNNLSFHIQVIQWHPEDSASAVGCRVSGVRPDMQSGQFVLASTECPNLYTVLLSDLAPAATDSKEKAKTLATRIRNQEVTSVESLVGYIQPSSQANSFRFEARRER